MMVTYSHTPTEKLSRKATPEMGTKPSKLSTGTIQCPVYCPIMRNETGDFNVPDNRSAMRCLTCGTFGVLNCSGMSSIPCFSRLAPLLWFLMPGMAMPRILALRRPPLVVLLERLTLSQSSPTPPPPVMRKTSGQTRTIPLLSYRAGQRCALPPPVQTCQCPEILPSFSCPAWALTESRSS